METVGTSPKAIAAAITATVAPVLAALLARLLGADIEVETVVAVVGPVVLGGVTFLAARLANPGTVVTKRQP